MGIFLPFTYSLRFPGRMVLYLKYFPISPNIITLLYPEFNAIASEKQKSMWYSISHTCFVFLQETAHNKSKYYHIFIITNHVNPHVKLLSSDLEVIPHRIRHRLARFEATKLWTKRRGIFFFMLQRAYRHVFYLAGTTKHSED